MIRKIKMLIPERFKGPLLAVLKPGASPELEVWKGRRKVVIALAGFYQNLGDMALTYAQKRFIEESLPDYEVLLFPSTHTYGRMKALKRVVGPDDIITTIGGGNMDDVYPSLENARRFFVRTFSKNPFVSFPQTMSFSKTSTGERALRRSARTYRRHPFLTIFAREPLSLSFMGSGFPGVHASLSPDIVLSLTHEAGSRERSGIMLTMREDKESKITSEERAEIYNLVTSFTDDVLVRDTVDVAIEDCQPETYESTLKEFWDLVATRRVVVTDRLHGMIFCVITRTPVVVLSNNNHKIFGTYQAWLKGHSFVRYLDVFDPVALSETIDELWRLRPEQIIAPDLSPLYGQLRQALVDAAGMRS